MSDSKSQGPRSLEDMTSDIREPTFKAAFFRLNTVWLLLAVIVFFIPDIIGKYVGLPRDPAFGNLLHLGAQAVRWIAAAAGGVFAVDMLVGFPSSIRYVEERMAAVLLRQSQFFEAVTDRVLQRKIADSRFLATLNPEQLETAHASIVEALEGGTFPRSGTFYSIMRNDIEPLLVRPHVDLVQIHLYKNEIIRDDKGTPIHLRSSRRITYDIHSHSGGKVDLGFARILREVDGYTPEQLYELESFVVGDESMTDRLQGPTKIEGVGAYRWVFEYSPEIGPEVHTRVARRETVLIPFDDYFDWRVRDGNSCKSVEVLVEFDEVVHPKVMVNGLERPVQDFNCQPDLTDKTAEIRWSGWMLPYHSVVVTWGNLIYGSAPGAEHEAAGVPPAGIS